MFTVTFTHAGLPGCAYVKAVHTLTLAASAAAHWRAGGDNCIARIRDENGEDLAA